MTNLGRLIEIDRHLTHITDERLNVLEGKVNRLEDDVSSFRKEMDTFKKENAVRADVVNSLMERVSRLERLTIEIQQGITCNLDFGDMEEVWKQVKRVN